MSREIPLTQGQVAIVDDQDFEFLSQWKWHACKRMVAGQPTFYAKRTGPRPEMRATYMHRVIANVGEGLEVDHVNGNRLDNRRSNLRPATSTDNKRNCASYGSSPFKGVSFHKQRGKWQVKIKAEGRVHWIGLFVHEADAARAYDAAAIQFFGEFARLNFPNVKDDAA